MLLQLLFELGCPTFRITHQGKADSIPAGDAPQSAFRVFFKGRWSKHNWECKVSKAMPLETNKRLRETSCQWRIGNAHGVQDTVREWTYRQANLCNWYQHKRCPFTCYKLYYAGVRQRQQAHNSASQFQLKGMMFHPYQPCLVMHTWWWLN